MAIGCMAAIICRYVCVTGPLQKIYGGKKKLKAVGLNEVVSAIADSWN